MGFRQNNKQRAEQDLTFREWLDRNRDRVARSGLPASVLATRDDWAYFLRYRYHDQGNWNTPPLTWIDFTEDELTGDQRIALAELEADWAEYAARRPILAARLPSQKAQ